MSESHDILGFIGLGAMGGAMARNLIAAGHTCVVFDLDGDRLNEAVRAGASAGENVADVVNRAVVVFTSLTDSETFVRVAEGELLPNARADQVFIDLGTVMPDAVHRLAAAFAAKGAHLLDIPVSGGVSGAQAGTLRMFAGGDEAVFSRIRPVLAYLGDPDFIVYCGGSGSGQIVKFVNQMAMGLSHAVLLESVALGVKAGVDPALMATALGGDSGWRQQFKAVAERIAAGEGTQIGVKFGQLHYFMEIAQQLGLALPLSEALRTFCEDGERIMMEANRHSPSFWHELMQESSRDQ